ncbi:hypothetical protein AXE80_06810 [Wenyingzhuangia fucanilytica]|uniref:DUF4856 domain-containing protein n=1 Tax=Wenyingzhuangia fucanilytica TaxID=1790137 RepID=A0A1B1Y5I9_9FLAO|nr:DUF4856 domain-containing protein [Wenyingzhuangia fucanilytica]ANW96008.1 hypothetical protein AXE80_06810 [Wenyingzhuangia fucanilytica]
MKITKLTLAVLVAAGAFFTSCSKGGDDIEDIIKHAKNLEDIDVTGLTVPENYEFSRNETTTVDYSGQTTRLLQVNEIGALLTQTNPLPTQEDFTNRFNQAVSFTDASLNGSKNVRSKVAASVGLYATNQNDADAIKADFDSYLTNQLAVIASDKEASQGVAGIYDGKRYFNEKGLEYNQAFYKGLIGALAIDQTLNHYFNRLDDNFDGSNAYRTENDAVASTDGSTTMEHHFDEAYGYVYGAGDADKLLGHYLEEVAGQSYFSNIREIVKKAFLIGRAAIVAKKYDVRDAAVEVIRYQISKIPAARGVYYLQKAKASIDGDESRAAFHALSEGYGFIYSLQFTYNVETKAPYFTKAEVDALLTKLYGSTNGFYDLTADKLEEISEEILEKYDFNLEQVNQ